VATFVTSHPRVRTLGAEKVPMKAPEKNEMERLFRALLTLGNYRD